MGLGRDVAGFLAASHQSCVLARRRWCDYVVHGGWRRRAPPSSSPGLVVVRALLQSGMGWGGWMLSHDGWMPTFPPPPPDVRLPPSLTHSL